MVADVIRQIQQLQLEPYALIDVYPIQVRPSSLIGDLYELTCVELNRGRLRLS